MKSNTPSQPEHKSINHHTIEKCRKCQKVIRQCRCMGAKVVRYILCTDCAMTDAPQPHQEQKKEEGWEDAKTNPSYDQTLPAMDRIQDYFGAYHIEINGSSYHDPFYLDQEEGGGRCDTEIKQEILEYLDRQIQSARRESIEEATKIIESTMLLHKHDSIPSYTAGLEDGCTDCLYNHVKETIIRAIQFDLLEAKQEEV